MSTNNRWNIVRGKDGKWRLSWKTKYFASMMFIPLEQLPPSKYDWLCPQDRERCPSFPGCNDFNYDEFAYYFWTKKETRETAKLLNEIMDAAESGGVLAYNEKRKFLQGINHIFDVKWRGVDWRLKWCGTNDYLEFNDIRSGIYGKAVKTVLHEFFFHNDNFFWWDSREEAKEARDKIEKKILELRKGNRELNEVLRKKRIQETIEKIEEIRERNKINELTPEEKARKKGREAHEEWLESCPAGYPEARGWDGL